MVLYRVCVHTSILENCTGREGGVGKSFKLLILDRKEGD